MISEFKISSKSYWKPIDWASYKNSIIYQLTDERSVQQVIGSHQESGAEKIVQHGALRLTQLACILPFNSLFSSGYGRHDINEKKIINLQVIDQIKVQGPLFSQADFFGCNVNSTNNVFCMDLRTYHLSFLASTETLAKSINILC
jgi:hypothetical protein